MSMKWVKNSVRFVVVTVAVIAITSFTIDATDALRGSQSALSIIAQNALKGECPSGMKQIDLSEGSLCVDVFENSPGDDCLYKVVESDDNTQKNLNTQSCVSASQAKALPWTNVNYHQAKALCANRGARLPTALEWYEAALSTNEDLCNLDGSKSETGKFDSCVSARGMYDMVGNVWEWVDEEVINGSYQGRSLPEDGYVTEADMAGVAAMTSEQPNEDFSEDYFWHSKNGVYAMMRGGFYGSEEDGGVYAVHTEVRPSFSSAAIGFRCVMNI